MSSSFLSHLQAKDKRETIAKVTKAVIGPAVNFGADFATVAAFKSTAAGKAVGSAAAGLESAAIDGVKSACDLTFQESSWKLLNEMSRRYDDIQPFKAAVLFATLFTHYFNIDNSAINKPFEIDRPIVELENFKLDGFPPNRYLLQRSDPDIEDKRTRDFSNLEIR